MLLLQSTLCEGDDKRRGGEKYPSEGEATTQTCLLKSLGVNIGCYGYLLLERQVMLASSWEAGSCGNVA